MKILALDSSGLVASVAVLQDDILIGEYTVNYKKTHSQTLLPMLEQVKKIIQMDLKEIDAIALAAGPGSFTGLRIGSATAKGLGLALGKPLVAVPTLEGLAYNFWGTDRLICPMMDARRDQVYTGIYEFVRTGIPAEETQLRVLTPQCAVDVREIIARVNQAGMGTAGTAAREVVFLGDGVPVYEKIIREEIRIPCMFAPAHLNRQRAGSIAALGAVYYKKGKIQTAAEHRPEYLRSSQAERERLQRESGGKSDA